jgi:diguanylate cyclase
LLQSRGRIRQDAAVLFCDLDGFKQINDTLGHDAGDRVLIEVGRRLCSTMQHSLVARFAGDEFAVVIKNAGTRAAAEAAAKRLLTALAAPISVAGRAVVVSASVGIGMAAEHDTPAALLRAADMSMYEAKRSGGGRHHKGDYTIDTSDGL